jgi:prefoldin beta subunit
MKEKEDVQKKVAKLQMMEQRLQNYILQKQNFQSQSLEIENALIESGSSDEIYRIVGQIMIKVNKEKIREDLRDKKIMIDKKIKEIEKQEEKLREDIFPLQQELMDSFKNEK